MTIEPLESAEKFYVALIGYSPKQQQEMLAKWILEITRAAEERMREKAAELCDNHAANTDKRTFYSDVFQFRAMAEEIRAMPLSTDAPTEGAK